MEITIQNEHIVATINSFGAELVSLNKDHYNYIWTINNQYWNKTSPILFPIVGSLRNNSYTINKNEYSLSRHGFARDYEFDVIEKSENSITFSLLQNEETLSQFPFHFNLQISYTLEGSSLIIAYKVYNNSTEKMPFAIGAHPAFAIEDSITNYALLFENDHRLIVYELENGLLSGKSHTIDLKNNILTLSNLLFEKDALVMKKLQSKHVTILKDNIPILKVILGNFPHLGIWTKPNAPFLCIEPWQGYTDNMDSNGNIFDKEGIITINNQEDFKTSFSIEIV